MDQERIMTLHPQGKKGVHILKSKYDLIADFLIRNLQKRGEISFIDLSNLAEKELSKSFDGKITWYLVTIKLDLEARGFIERIPNSKPQILRLKN